MRTHDLINRLHPDTNIEVSIVTINTEGCSWDFQPFDIGGVSIELDPNTGAPTKVWIVGTPTNDHPPAHVDITCPCGAHLIVDETMVDDPHLHHHT